MSVKLEAQDIHVSFGGVKALLGVNMELKEGEILSIIGPNGAGKTTLINAMSGVYHPERGRILLEGQDITHLPPHRVAALGIARTFQNVALFAGMSALDNIMLGGHVHMRSNPVSSGIYWGLAQKEEVRHRELVEWIIDFLEIQHIRKVPAGALPMGLKKRVELGRALALKPKVLMLDEPMSGMNLEEKEDMARFVLDANEEMGSTIILVEHDMGVVMDISHRVVVLDQGIKIADAGPEAVRQDPVVIKAYLGAEMKAEV